MYRLFGVALESEIEFPEMEPLSLRVPGRLPRVIFRKARVKVPLQAREWILSEGLYYWRSPDQDSIFVRSPFCGDFQVDFHRWIIGWKPLERKGSLETARLLVGSRILGLVLPHIQPALLLHAGIPVIQGGAVCFLGQSGRGKSTLTAHFTKEGFPLLSDELAVIQMEQGRKLTLPPGLPDIRLWPKAFKNLTMPVSPEPIMPYVAKKRFRVHPTKSSPWRRVSQPVPLRALYVLSRKKRGGVEIKSLKKREAFLVLVRGTYNRIIEPPAALRRQFDVMAEVIRQVPVKRLCYPSGFSELPQVKEAILRDLRA